MADEDTILYAEDSGESAGLSPSGIDDEEFGIPPQQTLPPLANLEERSHCLDSVEFPPSMQLDDKNTGLEFGTLSPVGKPEKSGNERLQATGFSPSFTDDEESDLELGILQRTSSPAKKPVKRSERLSKLLRPWSSDSDDVKILETENQSPISISSTSDSNGNRDRLITKDVNVLSSSSDENSNGHNVVYHVGNKHLPIYSKSNQRLLAKDIFKLCFGEVDEHFVCKEKPVGVRYNAIFVVDLKEVELRSLYADDNGVWTVSTPRNYYKVEFLNGKVDQVAAATKYSYTHALKRQYGRHQATFVEKGMTFQRIISTVFSVNDRRSRYAVVQYIHRDGSEEDIVVHSHGNAKSLKRPFYKTSHEVYDKIKDEPLDTKPKKVFKTLIDEAGGPLLTSSAASEPRGMQQIYNVRKTKRIEAKKDDFTNLIYQVKESQFVHDLTIDSESVQYTLASDKQLKDMELFCTHPLKFSVLSIDSTYEMGNYYLTNTCYENLKVVHTEGKYKGKHPLEIGPQFIHTQKNTNNFVGFFSSLLRMNSNLKNLQVVGTDGDEALMNAVVICFQDTRNLLCSTHKKDNIRSKLKDSYRARDSAINHITSDIFGKESGTVYQKGLIDSSTSYDFDKKLMELKATWDCLVPSFHTWFVQYESDLFKKHLIKEVTELAQLDHHFSNNRIESVNDNVKDWSGRSGKLSLIAVNSKMEELVKSQQQEFEMAVYGSGPYDLAHSHEFLRQTRARWNSISAEERKNILRDFWNSGIIGKQSASKPRDDPSREDPFWTAEKGVEMESTSLSVGAMECSLNLPQDILQDIWEKAEELLSTEGSVVEAPGYQGVYVQHTTVSASKTSTTVPPHLITSKTSGNFSCDCRLYKSAKICQHVLVAAEKAHKLHKFFEWRKKQKTDFSVSDLVMGGIKSGIKGNVKKPRKGGRAPLEKSGPSVTCDREPLVKESSVESTIWALENMEKDAPFELVYLFQTKAQMCYGCSAKFKRETEQNDLVVRKYCEREYTLQGVKKTKFQFAYFHLKTSCVRTKFPEFKKEDLVVSKESSNIIPEEVRQKLHSLGVDI